jgi:hypothetical protein
MSERLNELLRQRALLDEHLAWLEAEIAAEKRKGPVTQEAAPVFPPSSSPLIRPVVVPASVRVAAPPPVIASPAAEVEREAESILEQYRTEQAGVGTSVKRGCFAYFFLAMVILVGSLVGFYFYVKTQRGH